MFFTIDFYLEIRHYIDMTLQEMIKTWERKYGFSVHALVRVRRGFTPKPFTAQQMVLAIGGTQEEATRISDKLTEAKKKSA